MPRQMMAMRAWRMNCHTFHDTAPQTTERMNNNAAYNCPLQSPQTKFYITLNPKHVSANKLYRLRISISSLTSKSKIKIYRTAVLLGVLSGCETWSVTLKEQHRLHILRKTFGPKKGKVTSGWKKLHNEELHYLYSQNIVWVIKSRRMRQTRQDTCRKGHTWKI
jgi:hypothetical protein